MNVLATMRQRQTSWGRRVLSLFAVVWLSLALQPCAMAMGGDSDHDCPHCPPPESSHHATHDMTGMPCATGADCMALDEINYDGRTSTVKVGDAQYEAVAILSPVATARRSLRVTRAGKTSDSCGYGGTSPPLNLLYCTYLN